jgi:hypothetical protein
LTVLSFPFVGDYGDLIQMQSTLVCIDHYFLFLLLLLLLLLIAVTKNAAKNGNIYIIFSYGFISFCNYFEGLNFQVPMMMKKQQHMLMTWQH